MTVKKTTIDVIRTLLAADGVEKKLIDSALAVVASDGYVPMRIVTRTLGVSRITIHRWCHQFGIPKQTRIGKGGSLVYLPGVLEAYENSALMRRRREAAEGSGG